MMKKIYIYLLITSIYFFLAACTHQKKQNIYFEEQGKIFHTYFHIKYAYERSLREEIVAELDKFDLSLNPFNEQSIIAKINRNEEVMPDSLFLDVFYKSMEISKNSEGKFDITCSPFINAWGFGFKHIDFVTPRIIDSLRDFVGFDKIRIEKGRVVKTDARVQLNASAIAKGYSCDIVANLLKKHGIENYMVEIGGEIAMRGKNAQGGCWHVGIDKPIDDITGIKQEIQTVLAICDKAVATSGNYRNYYVKDGKKYAHTIDPQTGYPAEKNILGATVIADDCMTADAYATAFMVSGVEKSKQIATKVPGLFYYFIYSKPDGAIGITFSDGFEQFFIDKLDVLTGDG